MCSLPKDFHSADLLRLGLWLGYRGREAAPEKAEPKAGADHGPHDAEDRRSLHALLSDPVVVFFG